MVSVLEIAARVENPCVVTRAAHTTITRKFAAPIGEMIAQLTREAQGIPVVQHLAPRRTKPGAMPRAILIANVNAIEC